MSTIVNSVGRWPFPDATDAYKRRSDEWVEIDMDTKDELLSVLPPIYCQGGFMVSDPATHELRDGQEVPIYSAVLQVDGRYFVRDMAQADVPHEYAKLIGLCSLERMESQS